MRLREACEAALKEKHFLDASQMEGFVDENAKSNQKQLEALGRVFNKAAEDDTPTEVSIIFPILLHDFTSSQFSSHQLTKISGARLPLL